MTHEARPVRWLAFLLAALVIGCAPSGATESTSDQSASPASSIPAEVWPTVDQVLRHLEAEGYQMFSDTLDTGEMIWTNTDEPGEPGIELIGSPDDPAQSPSSSKRQTAAW